MKRIALEEAEIMICMLEQDYFEDIFLRGYESKIGPIMLLFNVIKDFKEMKKRAKFFIKNNK